jgi:hypothetical protein
MLHGIIYAEKAEHLTTDPGSDFAAEVRSYFGSGTQLQELYLTPSLLTPAEDGMAVAHVGFVLQAVAVEGRSIRVSGIGGLLKHPDCRSQGVRSDCQGGGGDADPAPTLGLLRDAVLQSAAAALV